MIFRRTNSIRRVAPPLQVSPPAARRFLRRTLGLDTPFADTAGALAHLGYVQVDPINVCGRMHDLILRPRVAGYRAGDLHRFIHAPSRGHDVVVASLTDNYWKQRFDGARRLIGVLPALVPELAPPALAATLSHDLAGPVGASAASPTAADAPSSVPQP